MSADGKRFHSSTLKSSTLIASEIIQKPRRIASMNVTQATRVRVSSFFLFLFLSLSLSLSLFLSFVRIVSSRNIFSSKMKNLNRHH